MHGLYPPTDPEIRAELVATVRRWVAREVTPIASELEHADEYPHGLVEQMQAMGLFGVTIPEEHGGLGLDLLTYVGVIEEIAYGWMSVTGILNTHTIAAIIARSAPTSSGSVGCPGSRRARRGSLSLSEPDAGSDTRNISCRATATVTSTCRRHEDVGDQRSLRVDRCPRADRRRRLVLHRGEGARSVVGGITVGENIGKLGYKGVETVEMSYDDHRVRGRHSWASPAAGSLTSSRSLELGRMNIAARVVGVAQASLDAALVRGAAWTMGKPIAQHQAIQIKLADMATKVEASRLLTHSAAEKMQAGERADVEAGMAKLFASETALEVATDAMRIHGASATRPTCRSSATSVTRPARHRRGHQRDPATRHRPRAARPQSRKTDQSTSRWRRTTTSPGSERTWTRSQSWFAIQSPRRSTAPATGIVRSKSTSSRIAPASVPPRRAVAVPPQGDGAARGLRAPPRSLRPRAPRARDPLPAPDSRCAPERIPRRCFGPGAGRRVRMTTPARAGTALERLTERLHECLGARERRARRRGLAGPHERVVPHGLGDHRGGQCLRVVRAEEPEVGIVEREIEERFVPLTFGQYRRRCGRPRSARRSPAVALWDRRGPRRTAATRG